HHHKRYFQLSTQSEPEQHLWPWNQRTPLTTRLKRPFLPNIKSMRRSQQMFGEPHIHPNENLREFYNRTKEQVGEILILEQFCHILSSELRVWVMERDPHSTREETQILEIFLEDQQVSKSYQLEAPAKAIAAQGKPLGSGVLCGPRESEPPDSSPQHPGIDLPREAEECDPPVVGTHPLVPLHEKGHHHTCLPLQRHSPRYPGNVAEVCQP
uniref:SCAN box domain-containing protein n=1 Tax=Mola mola TaxID=94237 RepID=A0A3Q4BCA2_MOLML